MTNTIDDKAESEKHVFVKYGSNLIDEKIGKVESFGLKYIHKHEGCKEKKENKNENYNRNMKITACTIYKLKGTNKSFSKLFKEYTNLELISDTN